MRKINFIRKYKKKKGSFKIYIIRGKNNHLEYIIDIKIFDKEKKLETILQTIRIYCQDMGMEFRIEKFAYDKKRETTG